MTLFFFAVDAYGGVYNLHLWGGYQKNEYYLDFTSFYALLRRAILPSSLIIDKEANSD